MISMVVVLPAPLGPSSPKQTPSGTLKEMPATAVVAGYCLTSSRTSRMGMLTALRDAGFPPDWRAILADSARSCRAAGDVYHRSHGQRSLREVRARRARRRSGALGPRLLAFLRRIPAAPQAPRGAKAPLGRARRDALHRRAPGLGAVDASRAARAAGRYRGRKARRHRSGRYACSGA